MMQIGNSMHFCKQVNGYKSKKKNKENTTSVQRFDDLKEILSQFTMLSQE